MSPAEEAALRYQVRRLRAQVRSYQIYLIAYAAAVAVVLWGAR